MKFTWKPLKTCNKSVLHRSAASVLVYYFEKIIFKAVRLYSVIFMKTQMRRF